MHSIPFHDRLSMTIHSSVWRRPEFENSHRTFEWCESSASHDAHSVLCCVSCAVAFILWLLIAHLLCLANFLPNLKLAYRNLHRSETCVLLMFSCLVYEFGLFSCYSQTWETEFFCSCNVEIKNGKCQIPQWWKWAIFEGNTFGLSWSRCMHVYLWRS